MPALKAISQKLSFFVLLFGIFISGHVSAKIDDSLDIFFPPSLRYLQFSQTQFSAFWWNFLIIDPLQEKADFQLAEKVCNRLHQFQGQEIKHLVCGQDLSDYMPVLKSWAQDFVLREKFDVSYRESLARSLSEFSYLSSTQKDLWSLKRSDPTDQWQKFLEKSQSMSPSQFQRVSGVLLDPKTQRIIIPLQFSVTPKMSAVENVAKVIQESNGLHWVGAHSSAYANEKQVHSDLDIVSLVGILVLLGFILFLVLKKRIGALLLFPPVALAMFLAAFVVTLIDGSIHGLTLAFGSGIVGLAIDYGLHGSFNSGSKWTWRSNTIGLLTTFIGLAVLSFSGIPLLRQMMIFASLGIIFGFLFFYFLCKKFPKYFQMKPLDMPFVDFKGSGLAIVALIVFGGWGATQSDLSFDISKFNFQEKGDAEATRWFFSQGSNRETFIVLHEKNDLYTKTTEEQNWSLQNQIQYEGVGAYLPGLAIQNENVRTWVPSGCSYFKKNLSETELKVFAPFVEGICQSSNGPVADFQQLKSKSYLEHLIGQNEFVSLLFAKDKVEEQKIREHYPEAHSLVESVKGFSESMSMDLKWMIPLVFILCSLILGFYYRNIILILASYIPFLSGLGFFWLAKFIQKGSIDLISILGLLMVFGFSVDYGVFITDIFAFNQDRKRLKVVNSLLTLAALTNIIGFFPMVFAKHPVLHQLGFVLFFGTMGTFLGTRWGLEKFLLKFYKPGASSLKDRES
jgi:hypothetical protein